jgi:iron complex transport system substrate-binding protein
MQTLVAENPKFVTTRVVKQGNVYNCTAKSTPAGGSDFWESGALWADRVLADMIAILHPEEACGHTLYYYEQVK